MLNLRSAEEINNPTHLVSQQIVTLVGVCNHRIKYGAHLLGKIIHQLKIISIHLLPQGHHKSRIQWRCCLGDITYSSWSTTII